MYYSADYAISPGATVRCVGTATATSPNPSQGFTASDKVLLCSDPPEMGMDYISAQLIQNSGTNYLVAKHMGGNNGTNPKLHSHLKLFQLSADGLTLAADPLNTTLYTSTTEDQDAEGPSLICPTNKDLADGTCFLFYVVQNYQTYQYAIHYVVSTSGIQGPYTANGINFLSTGTDNPACTWILAPGGPSFIDQYTMMFMTTMPRGDTDNDCCNCQPTIRGPRIAHLEYEGTSVSLQPASTKCTQNQATCTAVG